MTPAPLCPSCGYDQSGQLARIEGHPAPQSALCTECGTTFLWADALKHATPRVPGFFEHSRGIFGLFTTAWRTWFWAILPWRFWSRVPMDARVRPWRAACWVVVLWLIPLAVFLGCRASARFTRGAGAGFIEEQSVFATVLEHAQAAARETIWPIQEVGGMLPMWLLAQPGQPTTRFNVGWIGTRQHLPGGVLVVLAAAIVIPTVLLALRHTCQSAGITWKHLWRAAMFSNAWLGVAMLLLVADVVMWRWTLPRMLMPGDLFTRIGTTTTRLPLAQSLFTASACWGIVLWLLLWWYFALSRGMKLPRPARVWFAAAVPALLASATVWIVRYGATLF